MTDQELELSGDVANENANLNSAPGVLNNDKNEQATQNTHQSELSEQHDLAGPAEGTVPREDREEADNVEPLSSTGPTLPPQNQNESEDTTEESDKRNLPNDESTDNEPSQ